MNIKDFLKKYKTKGATVEEDNAAENDESENDDIGKGTKVKVLAALLVAGFAAYVAWWVQEPTQMSASLLSANAQTTTEESSSTEQVAALTTGAENTNISIKDFAFDPSEVMINKGETVTWTNADAISHTVTGTTFSSGTLNAGDSYSYTFTEDGTYDYSCSFHPQMKGKVIVGTGVSTSTGATDTQETILPATTDLPLTANTQITSPEPTLYTMENAEPATEESLATEPAPVPEAISATQEAVHAAAANEETDPKQLAKSGPEDVIYLGIFGIILYLNRKKLVSALR